MGKILITGGTGIIGRALTELFVSKGHHVIIIGRGNKNVPGAEFVSWDPSKKHISNPDALKNVDTVVNLAGSGIMDHRWTRHYKNIILDSRIESVRFLFDCFNRLGKMPETLIGVSAIGIYGLNPDEQVFNESSVTGTDFLAQVCHLWENSYKTFGTAGTRVCITRLGVVLSPDGGAFPTLLKMAKLGLASPFGNGEQAFCWVHQNDVTDAIEYLIHDKKNAGVFNIVAPAKTNNRTFIRTLCSVAGRPMILPAVPGFVLNLILGERASTLTKGVFVSSEKIEHAGYQFKYTELEKTLNELVKPTNSK